MKVSILQIILLCTSAYAAVAFQTKGVASSAAVAHRRDRWFRTNFVRPNLNLSFAGSRTDATTTHIPITGTTTRASVSAEPQQTWTPKRLHNTSWFRSAAILLAISLIGMTQSSPIARLPIRAGAALHLLAFSTWFGTMVYTTFVLGITAFKNLPRQTFGKLQAKLFPKYFSLGSICLILQIVTLPSLSLDFFRDRVLTYSLGSALLATLYNQFSLEPYTTKIMLERYELENIAGGDDSGIHTERYKELRRQFGKMHGLSSLTNLIALCGTMAYGWILAGKLVA